MKIAVITQGDQVVGVFSPEAGARYLEGVYMGELAEYDLDDLEPSGIIKFQIYFKSDGKPHITNTNWAPYDTQLLIYRGSGNWDEYVYVELTAPDKSAALHQAQLAFNLFEPANVRS